MPGPVERWLETFMCKQYANVFEAFGFKTLQSVCQLQPPQLQAMGVAQEHCDKILENVHVLRQTLSLSGTMNYQDEMSGNGPYGPAGNALTHPSHPSMGYPTSDTNQMAMMGQYAAMQGYRDQIQNQSMMSPPHYPNAPSVYRNQQQQQQQQMHQHHQQQQFMNQQFNSMYGNQNFGTVQNPMMMNAMGPGNPVFGRSPTPQGQGAGSPSVHPPPHPHLRQGGHPQNPQQVADNILQMASSTYSSSQTVQVPLNKGRSAPYHNPRTNYNMSGSSMAAMQVGLPPAMGNMSNVMAMQQGVNMQVSQPRQVMQPASSPSRLVRNNAQFGYPSLSPHPHQPRTSPISPMPMHSPASQHSNQSVHNNPSPGPLQSPAGAGSIRSPVSPNMPVGGIQSPCGKQHNMMSASPAGQQLRSPNQHIPHMNSPMMNCTPISPPSNPMVHNNMRSPLNPQSQQHHSPHPQYYPHIHQTQGHYSPVPHSINSPLSHTSSPPYIQGGARISPPLSSPHSSVSKPSPSGSTGSSSYVNHPPPISLQKLPTAQFNPLQSLQKLVMLPETQVVDPKSVVNDACLSSPSQEPGLELELPKNCDISTDLSRGGQLEGKCVDGKHCEASLLVTPTPSFNPGQPCAEPKSDNACVQTNGTEAGNKSSVETSSADKCEQVKANQENVTENVVEKRTSDDVSKDQPVQNNHVQEKPAITMNSATDRKQGIGNNDVQVQKSKQENMSPKKRFLGSQPMMNGSPVKCDSVKNSNSSSELTTNGPDTCKPNVESSVGKLRVKVPYSQVCSSEKVLEKKHSEPDSNGTGDTDGYVNKKFFKKRRAAESTPFSIEIASCGNSERGSQVSCSITSVIQAPPHLTAPVYDDVSDASDIDEELSVRKDSTLTYTRETTCRDYLSLSSSAMFKSISSRSFAKNHSDSHELYNNDNTVRKPFQDLDKIPPERSKDPPIEAKTDDLKELSNSGGEVQKSFDVTNHTELPSPNSPFSNMTESSKSVNTQDEPDTIVSLSDKLPRPKRKTESEVTENSKFKANSLNKEVPFRTKKQLAEEKSSDRTVDVENNESLVLEKKGKDTDLPDKPPLIKSCEVPLVAIGKPPNKPTKPMDIRETSKSVKSESKVGTRSLDSRKATQSLNKDDDCSRRSSVKGDMANESSPKSSGLKRKSLTECSSGDASENDVKSDSSPLKPQTQSISESDTPKKRGLKKWKTSLARDSESSSVEQSPVEKETKSPEAKVVTSATKENIVEKEPLKVPIASNIDSTPSSSKMPMNSSEQPFQKRRGRPPGSKNKVKKDKDTKRKRDVYDYNSDEERKSSKSSKKSLTMSSPAGCAPGGKRSAGRPMKKDFPAVGASSGPFIRSLGSKRKPAKCVIMNAPQDESESKPVKNKKMLQPSTTPSSSLSIQLSNLPSDKSVLVPGMSPSDETLWYCCICRKHSSYKFLGDLFGPYYPEGYQPVPSTSEDGSEKPRQRRKKMFVLADQVPNYAALMKPIKGKKVTGEKKLSTSFELASGAIADSDELWGHEDCVLWSDGVYLIENNIYGLQEAANVAATAACSCCKEVGASIGCLHKGCSQKYHYVCAVETDCYLDEENFSLLCLKHKEKRTKTTEQSSRKVS